MTTLAQHLSKKQIIFIIYSTTNDKKFLHDLGKAEYSYYFVAQEFKPLLQSLGIVVTVTEPEKEVDAIYAFCQQIDQVCVFLSFTPPHKTLLDLQCPTIPVFAWEYADIPIENWDQDPRNDWRTVFNAVGQAITHSQFAVAAVQRHMGTTYPVVSLPAPLWDKFASLRAVSPCLPKRNSFTLTLTEDYIDSQQYYQQVQNPNAVAQTLTAATKIELFIETVKPSTTPHETKKLTEIALTELQLKGIIYLAVFNPDDGRKNWREMIRVFCWTFKQTEDVTLVFKLIANTLHKRKVFLNEINKLSPFKCRVVVISEYLTAADYATLLAHSSYALNTSHGEGQCLPLMEAMSCGKPAISPNHSAMQEYLTNDNSFIVESSKEVACWPHDPRQKMRMLRYRINSESLMEQLQQSYEIACNVPETYHAMAMNAIESLKQYCSEKIVRDRLANFLSALGLD